MNTNEHPLCRPMCVFEIFEMPCASMVATPRWIVPKRDMPMNPTDVTLKTAVSQVRFGRMEGIVGAFACGWWAQCFQGTWETLGTLCIHQAVP